tara:strand:- start:83 stop:313 length:231 start_codon:yes stop_codon:yes gene_type:complete
MKEGDLCYLPQGVVMIKQDSSSLPVGHYTNEKPASALILENEPTANSMYVLFKGEKWAVLKREAYPLEEHHVGQID